VARTIGKVKIRKLKCIVTEMWTKNRNVSEEEIINALPPDWWDTWESADSEIRRIVSDTLFDFTQWIERRNYHELQNRQPGIRE
jgi:hypothetical protein